MSTRCNVVLKDNDDTLWFYRHSDGYPAVAAESLKKFLGWVISGKVRDNVSQAGGWLVLLGAVEYQTLTKDLFPQGGIVSYERDRKKVDKAVDKFEPSDWKCGAYEPTVGKHGDIEYLYTIDLWAKTLTCATDDGKVFYVVTAENIKDPVTRPV